MRKDVTTNGSTQGTLYLGRYYEQDLSSGAELRYYSAGPQRVAVRVGGALHCLYTDHLGSSRVSATGETPQSEWRYDPYGAVRASSGAMPTSYRFTGQREDSTTGLVLMGARWYDPRLGRWLQPDTIVPDPGNPQDLNRYSYTLNNPVKYVDPTGHWSEDQLSSVLGDDWRKQYFGEGAVFEGRDKLLEFLTSTNTKCPFILGEVGKFLGYANAAHGLGMDFRSVDAIGSRIALSGGSGQFGGASADAILNLASGELSLFLSPEAGGTLGQSLTLVAGFEAIKNLPTNGAYRGGFWSIGAQGGFVVGGNAEFFFSAPENEDYDVFAQAHGVFVGGGIALKGAGGYGAQSYSWEVYRESASGVQLFAPPNPLTVMQDSFWSVAHDLMMQPLLRPR